MSAPVLAMLMLVAKATVAIALAYAAAALLSRRSSSARHLLFAGLFAFLLLLPFAPRVVRGMTWRLPPAAVRMSAPAGAARTVAVATAAPISRASAHGAMSTRIVLTLLYVLGVLASLLPFAVALWRLRALRRNGRIWVAQHSRLQTLHGTAGIKRCVDLVISAELSTPVTFGLFRPTILLPAEAASWAPEDLDAALLHELEHVRRFDWPLQIASRVVCAAYWFHPLVWFAWHRMNLEAERAADDAVVRTQLQNTRYAEQLVALASRMRRSDPQSAVAMARRSFLSRRIEAILDREQPRNRATMLGSTTALAASALLLMTLGAFRVAATPLGGEASDADVALLEAAADGDIEAMQQAVATGAQVNAIVEGDGTPLLVAARHGNVDAMQWLLARGADVNVAARGDGNPLIAAAGRGQLDAVRLLLDAGASIEMVVPGDENALIQASGGGHLEVVRLLLSRGADANARVVVDVGDSPRPVLRTPLRMARRGGHDDVAAELLRAGARD